MDLDAPASPPIEIGTRDCPMFRVKITRQLPLDAVYSVNSTLLL